jgi:hypothetical protein
MVTKERRFGRGLSGLCLGLLISIQASAKPLPIFDVHTHYKWDQEEVTTPEQAIEMLDKAGVTRVVVIGTPADNALKLKKLAPERVITFWSPYRFSGDKMEWQFKKKSLEKAQRDLATGQYQGIGELHLLGGFSAKWNKSPVMVKLLELGLKYDLPLMVHNEFSRNIPSIRLCRANPDNRFLFAHAGAILDPDEVAEILEVCPNVIMDLAARDPWRYVSHPITNDEGRLLPDWEELILKYDDRFVIGSDTVWPVDRHSMWDEPDSGWQELPRFINFHRQWLSFLPESTQIKLATQNAERFFRVH